MLKNVRFRQFFPDITTGEKILTNRIIFLLNIKIQIVEVYGVSEKAINYLFNLHQENKSVQYIRP